MTRRAGRHLGLPALLRERALPLELPAGVKKCRHRVAPHLPALDLKPQVVAFPACTWKRAACADGLGWPAVFLGMNSIFFNFVLSHSTEQRYRDERRPVSPSVPPCCLSWWSVSVTPMISASCRATPRAQLCPYVPVPQSGCTAPASPPPASVCPPAVPLHSRGFEFA